MKGTIRPHMDKPLFQSHSTSWSWVLQSGAIADALDHYAKLRMEGIVEYRAHLRG